MEGQGQKIQAERIRQPHNIYVIGLAMKKKEEKEPKKKKKKIYPTEQRTRLPRLTEQSNLSNDEEFCNEISKSFKK